jgi:hypothetical protein
METSICRENASFYLRTYVIFTVNLRSQVGKAMHGCKFIRANFYVGRAVPAILFGY